MFVAVIFSNSTAMGKLFFVSYIVYNRKLWKMAEKLKAFEQEIWFADPFNFFQKKWLKDSLHNRCTHFVNSFTCSG